VIDPALENGYAAEDKVPFLGIPNGAGIIDIQKMHPCIFVDSFGRHQIKMQPGEVLTSVDREPQPSQPQGNHIGYPVADQ